MRQLTTTGMTGGIFHQHHLSFKLLRNKKDCMKSLLSSIVLFTLSNFDICDRFLFTLYNFDIWVFLFTS